MPEYRVYTHAQRQPGHGITIPEGHHADPWDAYTLQDEVFVKYWDALIAAHPDFTLYLCDTDDVLMAAAFAVPLNFDMPLHALPDGGWRWAVASGVRQPQWGIKPDVLCALGINVTMPFRKRGWSAVALYELKALGTIHHFRHFIAPVRPSQKQHYPLIPMQTYITWTRPDDGLLFDAWMRTHQKLGGRIVKVAAESMVVRASTAQWEAWTGLAMPSSGAYVIAGALNPVQIDRERDHGEYIEPNVWMAYDIG